MISSLFTKFLSDPTAAWWILNEIRLGVAVDVRGVGNVARVRPFLLSAPATNDTAPVGPMTSFTKNAVSLIIGPQPASYQPTEPSSKVT